MSDITLKLAIDWTKVRRVLVVRLRSIGDTVLATPSLIALREFLPEARIDVLLEDWIAPILKDFDAIDNVLTFKKDDLKSRLQIARQIRRSNYDIAFNLHGGTTATFFVRASGARYRVGLASYQYKFLYTHLAPSPLEFWQTEHAHSAEQQLAILGFVGVPVKTRPKSRLTVTESVRNSIEKKLSAAGFDQSAFALIHPVAAFDTKQWATENFARIAEFLSEKRIRTVAVATKKERGVLEKLRASATAPVQIYDDLTLPEITALAAKAKIFVGNDSGVAHIAAAVETPSVVIFGSSNINHWRPWTNSPNEVVREKMPCQPCSGYFCREFAAPQCIGKVSVESVMDAVERVLDKR